MDLATALVWMALHLAGSQHPRIAETVNVTGASRSIATPRAVTTLGPEAIAAMPAATVDDALRSVPGFGLFRRSSSRVANPTTQGATLRGLAASGSSRALVLADGVPLNDPVGGWVYWNRVPAAALEELSVARGAAGDLHGADAVGGVVSITSLSRAAVRGLAEGGTDSTARLSAYGGRIRNRVLFFGSAELFHTDGFVIVAPETRGSIDTPAGSRHGSFQMAISRTLPWGIATLRGSRFAEARDNGTPFQANSTRLLQVAASLAHRAGFTGRAYSTSQTYDQTFSAVLTGRAAERPTSEQNVGANSMGAAGEWTWFDAGATFGVAARHVTADLTEVEIAPDGTRAPAALLAPSQSSFAASGQMRAGTGTVQGGAGARVELWQSAEGETNRHVFFNPRAWLAVQAPGHLTLHVTLQSAFRGPTLNELYRSFRVGNTITQANAQLKPEGVHGIEAGLSRRQGRTTARLLGFYSRVDDAIVNVTLEIARGTIYRQRQNAARIDARGVELETETRLGTALVLTTSTSYTRSDFATGPLEGLRVPQVPQWHHAIGARGVAGRAKWSAEWRYIAEQFDDDRNLLPLESSSVLDARAGWMLTPKIEVFGAMENVLDEEQDVGRTPIRTIGLPRTSRVGVRIAF